MHAGGVSPARCSCMPASRVFIANTKPARAIEHGTQPKQSQEGAYEYGVRLRLRARQFSCAYRQEPSRCGSIHITSCLQSSTALCRRLRLYGTQWLSVTFCQAGESHAAHVPMHVRLLVRRDRDDREVGYSMFPEFPRDLPGFYFSLGLLVNCTILLNNEWALLFIWRWGWLGVHLSN